MKLPLTDDVEDVRNVPFEDKLSVPLSQVKMYHSTSGTTTGFPDSLKRARPTACTRAQSASEEKDYYRLYSEALVRKLEDKMLALEEINQALGQEITERKRAEEAIRESEERFRTVFERSTVGKSLTAPDGKFLRINKAFADVVEAMASHRPYRPALGLEKSMEEIECNRGVLYDPEVVDSLFKALQGKGICLEIE